VDALKSAATACVYQALSAARATDIASCVKALDGYLGLI
jgi:hypothetical protein